MPFKTGCSLLDTRHAQEMGHFSHWYSGLACPKWVGRPTAGAKRPKARIATRVPALVASMSRRVAHVETATDPPAGFPLASVALLALLPFFFACLAGRLSAASRRASQWD